MSFDWDNHYKLGGQSGDPVDYAKSMAWKTDVIKKYCNVNTESFLDVGCGDMQFWNGEPPLNYTGMDISRDIIFKNHDKYPYCGFFCADASTPMYCPSDVVMCFDMLWHIADDDAYTDILQNIKNNAIDKILIYTWFCDPAKQNLATAVLSKLFDVWRRGYQKYRDFERIAMPIFTPEFELIGIEASDLWPCGAMYVFQRVEGSV